MPVNSYDFRSGSVCPSWLTPSLALMLAKLMLTSDAELVGTLLVQWRHWGKGEP